MRIVHSHQADPAARDAQITAALGGIRENLLSADVRQLAQPRHCTAEAVRNQAVGQWIFERLAALGLQVQSQGASRNIIAFPKGLRSRHALLAAAHFDSVPGSPGADDNASAVAALLSSAAACVRANPALPVVFVAFNREEDGFVGSREFVEEFLPRAPFRIACAHILEMVGFASSAPASQRLPSGLPIQLPKVGDFLGLLANHQSGGAMNEVLRLARTHLPDWSVIGLEVGAGAERAFPVLARSDHVPFWAENLPAVMWTDTAEFRNPHYHQASDTPETLDYSFLARVTRLLAATLLTPAIPH